MLKVRRSQQAMCAACKVKHLLVWVSVVDENI